MCIILKYMKKPPRKKGDHHIEHDDHDNVDYRKSWSWGELFPGRGSGHAGCCTTRHLFRCMKVMMMTMMMIDDHDGDDDDDDDGGSRESLLFGPPP